MGRGEGIALSFTGVQRSALQLLRILAGDSKLELRLRILEGDTWGLRVGAPWTGSGGFATWLGDQRCLAVTSKTSIW
jgi:hypothetical protein